MKRTWVLLAIIVGVLLVAGGIALYFITSRTSDITSSNISITPPTPKKDDPKQETAPIGDVAALLERFAPNTTHEAEPHGVPENYADKHISSVKRLEAPNAEMTYLNIRGSVYVDESNERARNTRVAIATCEGWGLSKSSGTWEKIIDLSDDKLMGRAWKEDYSVPGEQSLTDSRLEADGSLSVTNSNGYNFHFFNKIAKAPLFKAGGDYRHFVAACSARLVLSDVNDVDDRARSRYIIDTGFDWKKPDNTCTKNQYRATLCYGVGTGKYIRVTSSWRRVVFSTLTKDEIATTTLPPEQAFLNPDGTFGDK